MRKLIAVLFIVAGLGVVLVTCGYVPRILRGLHEQRVVSAERFEPEFLQDGQYTRVTDGMLDLAGALEVGRQFSEEVRFVETIVPLRWQGHLPDQAREKGVTRRFVIFTDEDAYHYLQRAEDMIAAASPAQPPTAGMPFEVEGTVRHAPVWKQNWAETRKHFALVASDPVIFIQYGLTPPSNLKLAFFLLVGGLLVYSGRSFWKAGRG